MVFDTAELCGVSKQEVLGFLEDEFCDGGNTNKGSKQGGKKEDKASKQGGREGKGGGNVPRHGENGGSSEAGGKKDKGPKQGEDELVNSDSKNGAQCTMEGNLMKLDSQIISFAGKCTFLDAQDIQMLFLDFLCEDLDYSAMVRPSMCFHSTLVLS